MVLKKIEYDAAYFGDTESDLRRKSGYSNYLELETDWIAEKKWKDFIARHNLKPTDKILELGGAVGHFAKVAREQGLNVVCIDWSQWSFDNKVIPDLIQEDALTYLQTQPDNSFDVVVSFTFLDCIPTDKLSLFSQEIKRVATKQFHQLYERRNPSYYNSHELKYWQSLFSKGVEMIYG